MSEIKGTCLFCGKETENYQNYCSFECMIEEAKANGGKIICPNNLPIKVIRADNTMLEHEAADHPDYKFPITAVPKNPDEEEFPFNEFHGVIYFDDRIVVTIYECCYWMWHRSNGRCLSKNDWGYVLNEESLEKIKSWKPVKLVEKLFPNLEEEDSSTNTDLLTKELLQAISEDDCEC